MVTAPISTDSSNAITRGQTRVGEWNASFDFDVALNATPSYPNVIAPNESLADSSLPLSNCTSGFCCNHQYSVTAITTSAGAISERYAYTAYSQPTIDPQRVWYSAFPSNLNTQLTLLIYWPRVGRDAGPASLQGTMDESECGKVLGEGSDFVQGEPV